MRALSRGKLAAMLILFGVLVAFFSATYSKRDITDTDLNSLQTRALALHGDVNLSRYKDRLDPNALWASWHGNRYSIYGVGVSVPAVPIYAILARAGASDRFLQAAASIPFVAAAVIAIFIVLLRLFPRNVAVAGAAAFAFGTTMWPVAAMGFFQSASTNLFLAIGLAGLFSRKRNAAVVAGAGFAAAAFVRPTMAVALAIVGLFYLTKGWRETWRYAAGATVPVLGILIQNRWIWDSWLTGGYSHVPEGFQGNVPHALWGLLFGWWRGMIVYSPVLILGAVGFVMAARRRRDFVESRLILCGVVVIATILLYARFTTWYGGLSQFGYRYQLDVVPFLILLGAYAVTRSERIRPVAALLFAFSVLTMVAGAGPNDYGFDYTLFATRFIDSSLGQAWLVAVKNPGWSLLRLCGVAGIGCLFWMLAPRIHPSQSAER